MTLLTQRSTGIEAVPDSPALAPSLRVMDVIPLPGGAVWVLALPILVVVVGASVIKPLYGAGALLGGLALIWVSQRPLLLGMIAVAVVPVTSGLRRGLVVPGLRISEVVTVVAAVVLLGIFGRVLPGPRWRLWDWAAFAYCLGSPLFGLVNASLQQVPLASDDIQTMMGPVQFFLLYRTVMVASRTPYLRATAMRLLLLCSIPVSMLAILQMIGPAYFQKFAVASTGTTVFDTQGYVGVRRATSVFPIWHALAGYLLVILLLAVALLLTRDRRVLSRFWLITVTILGLVALVYSLTATVVVGVMIGVLVLGALLRRLTVVITVMVVAGVVGALVFLPIISERVTAQTTQTSATVDSSSLVPQTIAYRTEVWSTQYVPAMHGNWLNGYGTASPPDVTWQHTESGYLTLLLRGGLIYLSVAAIMVWLSWRAGRLRLREPHDRTRVALAATVASLAVSLVVIDLAFPYLTASGLPQAMWVVWALLAAAIGMRPSTRSIRSARS